MKNIFLLMENFKRIFSLSHFLLISEWKQKISFFKKIRIPRFKKKNIQKSILYNIYIFFFIYTGKYSVYRNRKISIFYRHPYHFLGLNMKSYTSSKSAILFFVSFGKEKKNKVFHNFVYHMCDVTIDILVLQIS